MKIGLTAGLNETELLYLYGKYFLSDNCKWYLIRKVKTKCGLFRND